MITWLWFFKILNKSVFYITAIKNSPTESEVVIIFAFTKEQLFYSEHHFIMREDWTINSHESSYLYSTNKEIPTLKMCKKRTPDGRRKLGPDSQSRVSLSTVCRSLYVIAVCTFTHTTHTKWQRYIRFHQEFYSIPWRRNPSVPLTILTQLYQISCCHLPLSLPLRSLVIFIKIFSIQQLTFNTALWNSKFYLR